MADFQVGDVVYLKSGGPAMTIVDVDSETGFSSVAWFVDGKTVERDAFYHSNLTKENPNTKPKAPLTGGIRTF